ncbi:MAG: proton-conducting transporter membrane subunit [Tissierellia bacterium]|nr:proton-conducting transporter membrane subunit [Tissierellia bacterium]
MNILIFLFLPLISGILLTLIGKDKYKFMFILVQSILFILSIINLYTIRNISFYELQFVEEDLLGIRLILDNKSSLFMSLNCFLFLIFEIYSYKDYQLDNLFHFIFLTIEANINMIFLSNDLFNIFVLIEVSTILCSILILYIKKKRTIYDGLVYLLTNTCGILFYLLGIAFIYKESATMDITVISNNLDKVEIKNLILPICLMLTGLSVKCALFPVFLWLPKAHGTHGAASVVSAMLSGIYIKSTLFVFIRLFLIFREYISIYKFFLIIGIITSLIGIVFAVLSKDLKLILAYHTISQIGLILIAASSTEIKAMNASYQHMFNHALFKASLFLTVGSITKLYGSRKISEIDGLFHKNKVLSMSLIFGILAITGAPLFNGSISKYFIATGYKDGIMKYILEVINLGTTISFIKLSSILFGKSKKEKIDLNEAIALILISVFLVITAILGENIFSLISKLSVNIKIYDLIKKAVSWLIYVVIAIISYRYILPKFNLFKKGVQLDLSFNTMIISIPLLFFFTLLYSQIFLF